MAKLVCDELEIRIMVTSRKERDSTRECSRVMVMTPFLNLGHDYVDVFAL